MNSNILERLIQSELPARIQLRIKAVLNANVIKGRRVRGFGMRGSNFEVDRRDAFGDYNEGNSVLSCYYCNNDKSNSFDYEIYKNIIGPQKKSLDRIIRTFK